MLNKCQFIGNLGTDPDIKTMQSGDRVANMSIGVSERWKNKNGEQQEKTEWVNVSVFNQGLIDNVIEKYIKRGSRIYVEGKLQTRKWQDQSGNDRYTTEIVLQSYVGQIILLDGKAKSENAKPASEPKFKDKKLQAAHDAQAPIPMEDDFGDEIPF